MSEKTPRFNPSELANNFDDNKHTYEQEQLQDNVDQYHIDLVGADAGVTDFSDEAREHLSELARYREWGDAHKDETQEAYEARMLEVANHEQEVKEAMFSADWDEAHKMNTQFDAEREQRIIDERNARIEASPELRQLKQAAENVLAARNELVNENAEAQLEREQDTTDRFYELWYQYEDKHGDTDKDIIDYFADSIDTPSEVADEAEVSTEASKATPENEAPEVAPEAAKNEAKAEHTEENNEVLEGEIIDEEADTASPEGEDVLDEPAVAEDKSTVTPSAEEFSQAIHNIDGTPETNSQEVIIEPKTPDINDEKFMASNDPESDTPSVNDPEFMKSNDPEADDDHEEASPKLTWLGRLKNKFSSKREHKEGENRAKHGRVVLGAVAVAAVTLATIGGVKSYLNNKEDTPITSEFPGEETPGTETPNDNENNSGNKHEADANEATKAKERKALMEADAWNIPAGGGGIKVLENLGLEEADWYNNDLDQKLLKKFPGTFYNHNGDVRIAKQGELPDEVKAYIIDQTDLLK